MPLGAMEGRTLLPILVAATPHHPGHLPCRLRFSPPPCLAQLPGILTSTLRCQEASPRPRPAVPPISRPALLSAQQAALPRRGARRSLPRLASAAASRPPPPAAVPLCAPAPRQAPGQDSWDSGLGSFLPPAPLMLGVGPCSGTGCGGDAD